MATDVFTLYIGNLLLPLMGKDFLRAAFAELVELGPEVTEMLHAQHLCAPESPALWQVRHQGLRLRGFHLRLRCIRRLQGLTSIINGVWANNAAEPLTLAKTRMIVTPVTCPPPTARARLDLSSLANTVDEATLASAFAGCPGFCGQQILHDYNPFGSIAYYKHLHQQLPHCYGETQTGPLGRGYIYFESAAAATQALQTMQNLASNGQQVKLQRPRAASRAPQTTQTKQFVMPTAPFSAPVPPFPGKPMLNPAAMPFYSANHWTGNSMKAPATTVFAADTAPAFARTAARRANMAPQPM